MCCKRSSNVGDLRSAVPRGSLRLVKEPLSPRPTLKSNPSALESSKNRTQAAQTIGWVTLREVSPTQTHVIVEEVPGFLRAKQQKHIHNTSQQLEEGYTPTKTV